MGIKLSDIKDQGQLEAIIKEAVNEATAKLEKKTEGLVSQKDFNEVKSLVEKKEAELEKLKADNTELTNKPKILEAFKKSGVKEKAYDDLFNSQKEELFKKATDKDEKALGTFLDELKKEKDYLFNEVKAPQTILNHTPNPENQNTNKHNEGLYDPNNVIVGDK